MKDNNNLIIGIVIAVAVFLLLGMFGFGGMMGGYGGFGFIIMIAFWVAVIVGIVFLVRWLATSTRGGGSTESALEILKKRYAQGEISKEEYEAKKKDLIQT